ncbi:MAG: tetratricopeptide repeat protein [Bacteroidales bacterium]|nr:tetratricopeptide repeat protein [Bacteroidales bacterium]
MKTNLVALILIALSITSLSAQNIPAGSAIDLMLIKGEYNKVTDTCRQILAYDSLNHEIYYKMGIAYQNELEEDSALNCYYQAARLNPGNKTYNFILAKGYYAKGNFKAAQPLLNELCLIDSLKWVYAYYLTGIYMQTGRYDEAINIYKRFMERDSSNCVYIDKIAYANIKKEEFENAIRLYNKSLSINDKDLTAIKNLAYLYSLAGRADTAIQLLTRGIEIESTDLDLYLSRASLYYAGHYTNSAMDDYMVVLSSGDSAKLYLKRIGIAYCNNLQPEEGINYLLKAYNKDPSDYETCSYLGQSYYKMKDMDNSIYYYNKEIEILTPVVRQLGLSYILLGESQKDNGIYREAIDSYKKSLGLKPDLNIYLIIANLYDEKLKDRRKAIYYYQKFLDNLKNGQKDFTPEYTETIKQRLAFLKTKPAN